MRETLEDRVRSLVGEGDREGAVELLKTVLKNDAVVDVRVDADAVFVETRRFRGTHRIREMGLQGSVIDARGKYAFKDAALPFEFGTATMNDEARARAERLLADRPEALPTEDDRDGRTPEV
ncbi:hypothetical protein [Halegenticoccus soli]|uniref:hypothetical protein n=1 Tax=Halegenticoccus soli TaxID=1985678 RepID=UPI000C6DC852|nr:hypothetical protein [Halegenticoccus soli]